MKLLTSLLYERHKAAVNEYSDRDAAALCREQSGTVRDTCGIIDGRIHKWHLHQKDRRNVKEDDIELQ